MIDDLSEESDLSRSGTIRDGLCRTLSCIEEETT